MGIFDKNKVSEEEKEEILYQASETKVGFIQLGRGLRVNADRIIKYEFTGNKIFIYYQDIDKVIKYTVKGDVKELDALLDCRVQYNVSSQEEV